MTSSPIGKNLRRVALAAIVGSLALAVQRAYWAAAGDITGWTGNDGVLEATCGARFTPWPHLLDSAPFFCPVEGMDYYVVWMLATRVFIPFSVAAAAGLAGMARGLASLIRKLRAIDPRTV